MVKVTNAFETRNAVANREDLSNTIYNIDPFDTPFMNTVGRRNVTNTGYDWQTESLPAASTANALEEGFTLSRATSQATVRQRAFCQISERDATVTGSQEAADPAGKGSEMAHQMALKSKVLKNDIESIALSDQPQADGVADGIRKTRAFSHWIATNVDLGATGANPVSATAARTPGTARAITEPMIRKLMQKAFDNGARPTKLLTGSVNKIQVDQFQGRANSRQNVALGTAFQGVTLYASDFGDLAVTLDRWMGQDRVYLVDPQYARLTFYRAFQQKPIAPIGDAETRMILAEWGIQVDNEKAHAAAFDLFSTNTAYGF